MGFQDVLSKLKKHGKFTFSRTKKILPGVRIRTTQNGVRLLLGGLGLTYSVPLLSKERVSKVTGALGTLATGSNDHSTRKSVRPDPFSDRVLEVGQRYLVVTRGAAQALAVPRDCAIEIIDIGGTPPLIAYEFDSTRRRTIVNQFVYYIENKGLMLIGGDSEEEIEADFEVKEVSKKAKTTDATGDSRQSGSVRSGETARSDNSAAPTATTPSAIYNRSDWDGPAPV